jgi:hypothetical protein
MAREHVLMRRLQHRGTGGAHVAAASHPALALQRSIGNHAVARMLQRAPAGRVTEHPTRTGKRIKGTPQQIAVRFADLRAQNREGTIDVLRGLEFDHLWGGLKSDVTNSDEEFSVRIDRQSPTPTHSNVQIQTNGTSISLATVLVADTLAGARDRRGVLNAVKQAFLASLADGMQWEVYDAEETAEVETGKTKGKSPDRGDRGKKKRGGGGGKRRQVAVQ